MPTGTVIQSQVLCFKTEQAMTRYRTLWCQLGLSLLREKYQPQGLQAVDSYFIRKYSTFFIHTKHALCVLQGPPPLQMQPGWFRLWGEFKGTMYRDVPPFFGLKKILSRQIRTGQNCFVKYFLVFLVVVDYSYTRNSNSVIEYLSENEKKCAKLFYSLFIKGPDRML